MVAERISRYISERPGVFERNLTDLIGLAKERRWSQFLGSLNFGIPMPITVTAEEFGKRRAAARKILTG